MKYSTVQQNRVAFAREKKISWILMVLCAGLIFLSACQETQDDDFISSATMESDLWKISPQVSGLWVRIFVREGDSVSEGQTVAIIDTVPIQLKIQELDANYGELKSNIHARQEELKALQVSHKGLEREYKRVQQLVQKSAATVQSKDQLESQWLTSQAKIHATQSAVVALQSRFALLDAKRQILLDQLSRCYVKSPSSGYVLSKYHYEGELAVAGRPLLKIGRTDSLWTEFFITQPQLADFKVGQSLRLRLDQKKTEPSAWVSARLVWIAPEAEFTPKGVQTREARNELVFRARALAENTQKMLKIGLPVEVWQ